MKKKTLPSRPDLVIWGGTALTMDGQAPLENAVIEITADKISAVYSQKKYQPPRGVSQLNAEGALISPGLINTHTHAGMSLLRGICDDTPLDDWLTNYIFPLERKWSSPAFVDVGTRLAGLEFIRSGTTTFNDMYYFSVTTAKVAHEMGLRVLCGQAIVDISGVEKIERILVQFDEFRKAIQKYPRVVPVLAPHSIYGLPSEKWKEMVAYVAADGLRLHTHLSEMQTEVDGCVAKYGVRPAVWFESVGLWEQKAIAAHAVCLDEKEIAILGKNKVGIAHCPQSNLKLETKICRVDELRRAGAPVGLGTDSTASNNNLDLLEEGRLAANLQTLQVGVGRVPAYEIVKMLTIEGAAALHLQDQIGSLEVGKQADIAVWDCQAPHSIPIYNPYSHLVYSAASSDVRHTVAAGRILMKDRKILTCDEKALLKKATQWGKRIAAGNSSD